MKHPSVSEPAPPQTPQETRTGVLKLVDVTKTYGNSTHSIHALQPISFDLNEGEFVIFFGPSGCGKSTLLNIIAGFENASSGEITLDGKRVEGPHHDRLMMFQEH